MSTQRKRLPVTIEKSPWPLINFPRGAFQFSTKFRNCGRN